MYSCLEHIEESMDRFLDEYGKLPILVEVELEHYVIIVSKRPFIK